MQAIKEVIPKIGIGVFVLVILFFGLKGCIVTVWQSPDQPEAFAIHGADGRTLAMIFMPEHKTYIVYSEREPEYIEAVLTKMRGTFGTHYFWRLWSLKGPGTGKGWFSYRVYPEGAKPVVMETTVLDKFTHGNGNATLPAEGDRTHPVILFSDDAVRFEGMWLEQEPTDPSFISTLQNKLSFPER